jgi:hypothetical protein
LKILITAATAARSHKLKRLLDQENTFVLADNVDLPAFMARENQYIKIPEGASPSFAHELLSLCLSIQVDYVFPLRKKEIMALAEARQLFEEYNIKVVVPSKPVVESLFSTETLDGKVFILYNKEFILNPDSLFLNVVDELETGVFIGNENYEKFNYRLFTAD